MVVPCTSATMALRRCTNCVASTSVVSVTAAVVCALALKRSAIRRRIGLIGATAVSGAGGAAWTCSRRAAASTSAISMRLPDCAAASACTSTPSSVARRRASGLMRNSPTAVGASLMRVAAETAARMSRSTMRPVRPLPWIPFQSIPSSEATRRARGLIVGRLGWMTDSAA